MYTRANLAKGSTNAVSTRRRRRARARRLRVRPDAPRSIRHHDLRRAGVVNADGFTEAVPGTSDSIKDIQDEVAGHHGWRLIESPILPRLDSITWLRRPPAKRRDTHHG